MPLELLQDSDSSLVTIGPHWPSSYPEYLSPHQDKDEQQRIVWARLLSQRANLAKSLKEQKKRYHALRRELNPRTTQVESSHDPLYRDKVEVDASNYAMGAVLMQRDEKNILHPVAFFSKSMNEAQHNYDIYNKELLGL